MSAVLLPAIKGLPMRLEDVDEVLAIEEDLYPFPWTRGNFVDSITPATAPGVIESGTANWSAISC